MKSDGLSVVSRTIRRIVSFRRSRRGRATGKPACCVAGGWPDRLREVTMALRAPVSKYLSGPPDLTPSPSPRRRGEPELTPHAGFLWPTEGRPFRRGFNCQPIRQRPAHNTLPAPEPVRRACVPTRLHSPAG